MIGAVPPPDPPLGGGKDASPADVSSILSSQTHAPLEAGFFIPPAWTTSEWVPAPSPSADHINVLHWPGVMYVSMSPWTMPSRITFAIPDDSFLQPNQLTDVPVKLNVNVDPAVIDNAALPPL